MKKRLFTCLLSLAVMFGCFAFPDSDFQTKASDSKSSYKECGDYRYIILEDGTAEIVRYLGTEEKLIIPDTLDGITVTSLEPWQGDPNAEYSTGVPLGAFERCETLESVVIPDTITHIGENSFNRCISLESITIPSGLTDIEGTAFDNTPWLANKRKEDPIVIVNDVLIDGKTCTGSVTVPNGVKSIAVDAFYNSRITDIIIPEGVADIRIHAFLLCNDLKSITIAKSVVNIESLGINSFGNTVIKCYSGTAGKQYAIDNSFAYELLDPALQGSVYYQKKYNNSAVRFIAEFDIDDIKAADHSEIMICLNGEKQMVKTKKAFYSIVSDGKKITAPEGKCFVISPSIEISGDGADILTAEFTLDSHGGSIKREITI